MTNFFLKKIINDDMYIDIFFFFFFFENPKCLKTHLLDWIKLIMECVCSVSYSILVNGQPVGNIKLSRGIHQRDPSSMLTKAEKKGVLTGVPMSKKGPRLRHLFFAHDNLIFFKANSVEWRRLTKLLEKYEIALARS
jgi:hypothetical protein